MTGDIAGLQPLNQDALYLRMVAIYANSFQFHHLKQRFELLIPNGVPPLRTLEDNVPEGRKSRSGTAKSLEMPLKKQPPAWVLVDVLGRGADVQVDLLHSKSKVHTLRGVTTQRSRRNDWDVEMCDARAVSQQRRHIVVAQEMRVRTELEGRYVVHELCEASREEVVNRVRSSDKQTAEGG